MANWFCCVQCCVCRKRLSSPRCRSELIDSSWVDIVPGQKCIKKKINNLKFKRTVIPEGNMKVTGSQFVLYWIHNDKKPFKQWVRNRMIVIFMEPSDWMDTQSGNMIADIGTRRVQDLTMVDQNSTWINGYDWMSEDKDNLPFKSFEEIRFSNEELTKLKKDS